MSEIKPALSAEEWAHSLGVDDGPDPAGWSEDRHGLAALHLHGQPFGFTRADVDNLRDQGLHPTYYHRLAGLADRIEALLPPEAEE